MLANIIRNRKKTGIGGGGGGIVIDGGDPYYSAVSLMLSMDGTNGSTTFTDSSLNALTVTSSGVAISDTAARSGFGQFGDFPGTSSSALTIPASSVFNFGTGDFTLEFWFNIPAGASGSPYGKTFVSNENNVWSAGAFSLYALASSTQFRPSFWINEFSSSVPILLPASGDYRDGNWHHLAIVRSGTAFSMYIDGVRVANGTHAGNCGSSTRNLMIGDNLANNGGDRNLLGKLDDLRISRFARYVSNFTPPTAALPTTASSTVADPYYNYTSLLLHMDGTNTSTNFVDSGPNALVMTAVGNAQISTAQSKYGGASGIFNGSNAYISSASSSSNAVGASNFTMECWFYATSVTNLYPALIASGPWGANAWVLHDRLTSYNTVITFWSYNYSVSVPLIAGTTTISDGQWYHVAITRSGNTIRLFVNGNLDATVTASTNIDAASSRAIFIGASPGAGTYFNGFIDDLRITKYARYASSFTPPAAALPEFATGNDRYFSNVSLLLHMDGVNGSTTFTDNSSSPLVVTAAGNAQISTSSPQYGTGSATFDGTTNTALSLDGSTGKYAFGTSPFTVEFWMYPTNLTARQGVYSNNLNSSSGLGTGPVFSIRGLGTTGVLGVGNVGASDTVQTSSNAIAANVWQHVALVREGTGTNQSKIYVNGLLAATGTISDNFSTSRNAAIGRTIFYSEYFTGKIDDIRITKGIARYVSNFTPPTTAFPDA